MPANPSEIATVVINGQNIKDWETVWVHLEFPSRWRSFRFGVSEFDPNFAIQIKPGMVCQIMLAGIPVIAAYVIERQAYFDAERHGVMISGQSKVSDLTGTSVMKEGGQYTNQTLQQIASDVCKPFGINVTTRGSGQYMSLPFDNAQVMISESPYHFIERLSRMRACFLADDKDGNLVIDGGGDFASGPALVQGQNIKWARATFTDMPLKDRNIVLGESTATDDKWGTDNNQSKATATNPNVQRYKPLKFIAPRSLGPQNMKQELRAAAQFETAWQDSTALRVEVGVQGWLAPGGGLWDIAQQVDVVSPMLPIQEGLVTQQVTFTQSNEEGTMTVLELVNARAMNPGEYQVD
jgi:prophage tail gpP-like protein